MSNAVERVLKIEPRLWLVRWAKGWYLLCRRQFVAGDAVMMECLRQLRGGRESVVGPEIMTYTRQFGRWMDQPSAEAADRIVEGISKTPLGCDWFGRSDEVLARLRQRLASGKRFPRSAFTEDAMIAAHHGDIDLAIDLLRAEFLVDGFGGFFQLWYPQLKQVRASPRFKTFLIDLGLPEMWRKSGSWGDFCEPVGDSDFRCR